MDGSSVTRQLLSAQQGVSTIDPPSRGDDGFSLTDGYAVGALLAEHRVSAGATPVGIKLGFTNTAAWESLGISDPFWAPMYDDTVSSDHDVSLAGLVQPRIEPEIVLGFRDAVPAGAAAEQVAAAIGWVSLGFEIVHCHYPDWTMSAADAIADFGLHAALLLGPRHEPVTGEVEGLADAAVTLRCDGRDVATGAGANALSGPGAAVEWLLRLPGFTGLRAGDMVTTGTLTAAQPLAPGQSWSYTATNPDLGTLDIQTLD